MQCLPERTQLVAEALAEHEDVSWVTYPGFEDPTHDNATKYLDWGAASGASDTSADSSAGGYSGNISFGLEGDDAAQAPVENTELASLLANVGDAKTLVIHPASTTHKQLTVEEQDAAGVTGDVVRTSVGIEDPADIVADLEAAIESASK